MPVLLADIATLASLEYEHFKWEIIIWYNDLMRIFHSFYSVSSLIRFRTDRTCQNVNNCSTYNYNLRTLHMILLSSPKAATDNFSYFNIYNSNEDFSGKICSNARFNSCFTLSYGIFVLLSLIQTTGAFCLVIVSTRSLFSFCRL